MKASKNTVPVLEIIQKTEATENSEYLVKYKGKFLHPEIYIAALDYIQIHLAPEDFLNFKAAAVPRCFEFHLILDPKGCMDLLDSVWLEVAGGKVVIYYSFSSSFEDFPNTILNPVVALMRIAELARKQNLKTTMNKDEFEAEFSFEVPLTDNLLQHYKRHMRLLNKISKQVENGMVKELMKGRKQGG